MILIYLSFIVIQVLINLNGTICISFYSTINRNPFIIKGKSDIKKNKIENLIKNKKVIKVITDIDDTVKSSGGIRILGFITIGGVDTQYKRGHIYPGVLQFGLELSKLLSDNNNLPSKITVLTARAKELKVFMALKPSSKICKAYKKIGLKNGYDDWGIGEVYYGSVVEWIISWRKGIRKFKNFELMLNNDINQGYVNTKYIIIGDTGERDEDAVIRIINKYPQLIRASFLHTVYDMKNKSKSQYLNPIDKDVNGIPIYYFRTYVGAAIKAYEAKIINKEALKRVTKQAIEELQISEINMMKKLQNNKFIPKFIVDKNRAVYSTKWLELIDDMKKCNILYHFMPSQSLYQHVIV